MDAKANTKTKTKTVPVQNHKLLEVNLHFISRVLWDLFEAFLSKVLIKINI